MKYKRKNVSAAMSAFALIGCILLSASVHVYYKSSEVSVQIPVANTEMKEGDKITTDDIIYKQVHRDVVSDKLITNPEDLVGNYILRDTNPGEYLYSDFVSIDYYERIADKAIYSAVPIPVNQLTSVNGEIKEDDFVLLSIVVGGTKEGEEFNSDISTAELPDVTIIESPQLSAVRVLGVVDNSGLSVNDKREAVVDASGKPPVDSSLPQPSMLILDCNPMQRALILQGTNVGKVQVSILPEAQQAEYRKQYLGIDTTNANNTGVNKEDATLSESGLTEEEIEKRKQELQLDQAEAERIAKEQIEAEIKRQAEEKGLTEDEVRMQLEEANQNAIKGNIENTMDETGIKESNEQITSAPVTSGGE